MMEDAALRQLHDELLARQPSNAAHDSAVCPFCLNTETDESHLGGDIEVSTFTQEELDAAVAEALTPLQEALKALKDSQQESEIDARIAAAKAELESRITDLQGELDSSVLKTTEAERQYQELVDFLANEQSAQEAAAQMAERKESRLSIVKEVASFPDEYLVANADRWSQLDDEGFEALVSDWKAISTARGTGSETTSLPKVTSMNASRSEDSKSVLAEVLGWNNQGLDPRTL